MRRIRLIIEYDGTEYVGWQVQPNGIAVQEAVERELAKLTGERCALHASGRTDSGVHALAQVAHFDTQSRIPADKFAFALNAGLPRDIRVLYSDEAEPSFHSRYDVKRKSYRYLVLNSPHDSAFTRNHALHVHHKLDVDKMNNAAALFLGEHDFLAFKASGITLENTVRTIFASEWSKHGDMLSFDVTVSGFMYNMVRLMVGPMREIGLGRRDADGILRAFNEKSRSTCGVTAPAHGLYLARVEYDGFDTAPFIRSTFIF